ncbi:hypothetical protein AX17_005793 [Amanita inopinata Kibby_2008]|nr:hypothetical protein AX17_005793 [Amanita inopinata Kibby_2008]
MEMQNAMRPKGRLPASMSPSPPQGLELQQIEKLEEKTLSTTPNRPNAASNNLELTTGPSAEESPAGALNPDAVERTSCNLPVISAALQKNSHGQIESTDKSRAVSVPAPKEANQDKDNVKPEDASLSSTLSGNKTHSGSPTRVNVSTTWRSLSTSNGNGDPEASNAGKVFRPSFFSRLIHLLIPCVSPSRSHDVVHDSINPVLPPSLVTEEDTHTKLENERLPAQQLPSDPSATPKSSEKTGEVASEARDSGSHPRSTVEAAIQHQSDIVNHAASLHELPLKLDPESVMSGGAQPPGSTIVQEKVHPRELTHSGDADESDGSSFTEDDDLEDLNGIEDVDDEEDRLILNGGTGIPLGPDGIPRPLLPPIAPQHAGRKCLILDLDETLVHSSFKSIQQADYVVPVEIEYHWHNVYVIKRPGVDNFLKRMGEIYEVVVFTASLSKYADPVLDKLDTHRVVSHRLFRESCYNHKGNYVKDLSQLGRPISDTIILDNSPASYIFHPNNAVPVSSWFNDPHDTELTDLVPFLADLGTVDDVRGVLDGAR